MSAACRVSALLICHKLGKKTVFTTFLAVLVGSALGGMARFWLADAVARRLGERFPWGTLAVNASGALAIGVFAAVLLPAADGAVVTGSSSAGGLLAWHLAGLGFLGSYTTVSSFSLQTLALAHAGAWRRAGANVVLSLGLCLGAVGLGLLLGLVLVRTLAGMSA